MLSNWTSIYRGIQFILLIPIFFFVFYLSLYSLLDDPLILEMVHWIWVLSIISLVTSVYLLWVNTSDWFWEMVLSWYEGTLNRTPTGYWFQDNLTHVVVTSSEGPVYSGVTVMDGKHVHSQLNPLDVTLFMELIGDS